MWTWVSVRDLTSFDSCGFRNRTSSAIEAAASLSACRLQYLNCLRRSVMALVNRSSNILFFGGVVGRDHDTQASEELCYVEFVKFAILIENVNAVILNCI
jgi:hypothetical protein